jgi:putative Mg2+ transporter-C (MgtC) family protein
MSLILEMSLKLLIALLLGALVGLEREWRKKPAGLRTHMLVSMGACLFTLVSVTSFSADPARVASGIVTGIGFIGAGSIMASKMHVQGITTAATLWVVAAIGLAVAAELYIPALVAAVAVFFVLQLRWLEYTIGDM